MNDNPLVSVVIPTYKRPEMLISALNSVLKQTYQNKEIIVVDDNNPNSPHRIKTEQVIKKYLHYDFIKYIKHDANKGAPAARNTGFRNAKGIYISFLDDDDILYPEKIEKQVNQFQNSNFTNLGLVYCKNVYLDANGKVIRYSVSSVTGDAFKYQLLRNISITTAMLIKKTCLEEVNGFRELVHGQEYDLVLRIFAKGYEVDYVDEVLAGVIIHDEDRITTGNKIIEGRKKIYEIKKKYFDKLTKKEICKINNLYYLSLFREYLNIRKYRKAKSCFIKAVLAKPLNLFNYIEILGLIIDYNNIIKIKEYLHKFKFILKL